MHLYQLKSRTMNAITRKTDFCPWRRVRLFSLFYGALAISLVPVSIYDGTPLLGACVVAWLLLKSSVKWEEAHRRERGVIIEKEAIWHITDFLSPAGWIVHSNIDLNGENVDVVLTPPLGIFLPNEKFVIEIKSVAVAGFLKKQRYSKQVKRQCYKLKKLDSSTKHIPLVWAPLLDSEMKHFSSVPSMFPYSDVVIIHTIGYDVAQLLNAVSWANERHFRNWTIKFPHGGAQFDDARALLKRLRFSFNGQEWKGFSGIPAQFNHLILNNSAIDCRSI